MRMYRMVIALLACALLAPAAASAQVVEVRVAGSRGMLGLFTETTVINGVVRMTVLDVVPRSPAAEAGLAAGDVLVAIDGKPATDELLRADRSPGDTIAVRIRRGAVERDVSLVAMERPANFYAHALPLPDSVLGRVAVYMDRVRTQIDSMNFPTVVPFDRADGHASVIMRFGPDSAQVFRMGGDSIRIFRFGGDSVNVFRYSANAAVLRATMDSARASFPRGFTMGDSAFVYHRANIDSLRASLIGAEGRLLRALPDSTFVFRPADIARTGIMIGMRTFAGAELSDLNPGLAEYFGVTDGVLVLNAVDGTPAARAGVRPGDVIVQVNQMPVRSVTDVRRAIESRAGARGGARAEPDAPVQLRVLRRGQPVDITIGG